MASVNVEITGDARKLEQTFEKINQGQKKVETGFDNVAKAGQESARQIESANEAAAHKGAASYSRILTELKRQGPEGREQAKRVEEYLKAAGKGGRRSMQDITDELQELDPAAAKAAANSEKAFAKFGTAAAAQVASVAGAYVGVQQAISKVIELNQKVIETNRDAFGGLQKTESGDARLLQVATSKEDFAALRERADALARDHGLDREEARQLVFTARSEGFESALGYIAGNRQVLDPASQAIVAGQLPTLFQSQGLTPEQAISGTLVGAQQSRLNFEQVASALPGAASGTAMQGASAEETIGALSVLAAKYKSGDDAAQKLKALATAMSLDQGVQGNAEEEARLRRFLSQTEGSFDPSNVQLDDETRKAFRDFEGQRAAARVKIDTIDQRIARGTATEKDQFDRQSASEFLASPNQFWDEQRAKAAEKLAKLEKSAARESLAGVGMHEGVRRLMAMSEEQRRGFLGNNSEVNIAYSGYAEMFEEIDSRIGMVAEGFANSGTKADAVIQARMIAEADPNLRALNRVARSERNKEIARERRAAAEGGRQAAANNALAGAEDRGVAPLRIAAAEKVADFVEGFGGDRASAVTSVTGDKLSDLQRDLGAAAARGNGEAAVVQLMANQLMRDRREDSKAMVRPDAIVTWLRHVTGEQVMPKDITDQMQEAATQAIDTAAGGSRSRTNSFFIGSERLAKEGAQAVDSLRNALAPLTEETGRELLEETRRANRLAQETLEATRASAAAATQTATNTRVRPQQADPGEVIRASAAATTARAAR